jgi:hypothetical protein
MCKLKGGATSEVASRRIKHEADGPLTGAGYMGPAIPLSAHANVMY